MPYQATVYNLFIASPGDVQDERQIVRDVVFDWNAAHAQQDKAVVQPIGWETHGYPDSGDHPQAIINRQLLTTADILVAIFWSRVGTRTPGALSGSEEEIKSHLASGRPAMIYFSGRDQPVDVDLDQLKAVRELKKSFEAEAFFNTFKTLEEFRQKFSRTRMEVYQGTIPPAGVSEPAEPAKRVLMEGARERQFSEMVNQLSTLVGSSYLQQCRP